MRRGDYKLVFAHPTRTYEGIEPGKDGFPGKFVENAQAPAALYDLRHDPGERYDVRAQYPNVVTDLEALAEQARQDLGDDLQGRKGANVRPAAEIKVAGQ